MQPDLTLIIPVWNEEEPIRSVLQECLDWASARGRLILVVNDGSTDRTMDIVRELAAAHPNVRFLDLPHGGKDVALWRGLQAVTTEWTALMDGDGQYDPRDIDHLLAKAAEARADGVWGVRAHRSDSAFRLRISRGGKWFKKLLLGETPVSDTGCGLWIGRTRYLVPIVEASPPPAGQVHCHLADLMVTQGGRVVETAISHRARSGGTAKFGMLNRLKPGLLSLLQARTIRRKLLAAK